MPLAEMGRNRLLNQRLVFSWEYPAAGIPRKPRHPDKELVLCAARSANLEFVQPNWGRVQQDFRAQCIQGRHYLWARVCFSVEELAASQEFPAWVWMWVNRALEALEDPVRGPIGREAARVAPRAKGPARADLERFEGRVDRIVGNNALVTLISPKGERLSGNYPADELAAHGVHESDRFTLTTVAEGEAVRFDIRPIPRRVITPERIASIQEEVRRELGGYTSDDDY